MELTISPYKNGYWYWDDETNELIFVSHDAPPKPPPGDLPPPPQQKEKKKEFVNVSIHFKDDLDNLEKITFKRHFQRHVRPGDPDVISLQDIKDVALYLASPQDLTIEFIKYFHLPEVDRYLKAGIIYFQYYMQVWEYTQDRKLESKRKLRQPVVERLENIKRDDLSDLRSMFAREYCFILMGVGKTEKFHHLAATTTSLSDKDRRLFEAMICITARVIWVALERQHLQLIDMELSRLMRGASFNLTLHRSKLNKALWDEIEENRMLESISNLKETKLKQRSMIAKEILLGTHDYRMLGAGFKKYEPISERQQYLEKLYAAPEERLLEFGLTIGLIGIPRDNYDCVMMPRERTSQNFDKDIIDPIEIKLPPYIMVPDDEMPPQFPQELCEYQESEQTVEARRVQCELWIEFLTNTEAYLMQSLVGSNIEEEEAEQGEGEIS